MTRRAGRGARIPRTVRPARTGPTPRVSPFSQLVLLALLALLAPACAGGREPGPPAPPPTPPDLTGARVMVLPAQVGSPAQLDAELGFWLTDRGEHTIWLLPDALQRTVDRSRAWRVRLDALPRRVVDAGGGDLRVTDPLYGVLRRLGAVEDTNVALVPVAARPALDSAGLALELTAAVVDIRAGRVVWLGTVRGDAAESDEASVAAAAEALARALIP